MHIFWMIGWKHVGEFFFYYHQNIYWSNIKQTNIANVNFTTSSPENSIQHWQCQCKRLKNQYHCPKRIHFNFHSMFLLCDSNVSSNSSSSYKFPCFWSFWDIFDFFISSSSFWLLPMLSSVDLSPYSKITSSNFSLSLASNRSHMDPYP